MIDSFLTETSAGLPGLDGVPVCHDFVAQADTKPAFKGMFGHFYAEQVLNHAARQECSTRHGNPADGGAMVKNAANTVAGLISAPQQKPGAPL